MLKMQIFALHRRESMELTKTDKLVGMLCGTAMTCVRRCLFHVLSAGPLPDHIALILDGNRRYARKWDLGEGMGHRAGFLSLLAVVKYCYELGIKYVTVYAFSIDNFKRKPQEVKSLMDLMMEKIEGMMKVESIVNQYGVRVFFIGNLKLLEDHIRIAAERAMKATEKNNKTFLLICVAYTSTDEIVHAAEESCKDLWNEIQECKTNEPQLMLRNGEQEKTDKEKQQETSKQKQYTFGNGEQKEADKEKQDKMSKEKGEVISRKEEEEKSNDKQDALSKAVSKESEKDKGNEKEEAFIKEKLQLHRGIKISDIEKHMYMAVAPDVDVLVRTSGEYRLSNFLLWQTWNGLLYSTKALWPEMGLPHFVWTILNFQITHAFFEKRKKQL